MRVVVVQTCRGIFSGCDVAHPSPGVKSRPSIASLVASVDEFATRYYTEVRVQAPRQETVDNVGGMIQVRTICSGPRVVYPRASIRGHNDGCLLERLGAIPEDDEEVPQCHDVLSRRRLRGRVRAG